PSVFTNPENAIAGNPKPSHGQVNPTLIQRLRSSTLSLMEVLYGVHPVEEALKAGKRRFDHVLVARERDDARLERTVALCREAGVPVRQEPREQLTLLAQTAAHQGVVAMVHPLEFLSIEDLFAPDPASAK